MERLDGMIELTELEDLRYNYIFSNYLYSLARNGLLSLEGIEVLFPNLIVLDVSFNKIFSVDNIDILSRLSNLAEINF